jgi:hypothetical protein
MPLLPLTLQSKQTLNPPLNFKKIGGGGGYLMIQVEEGRAEKITKKNLQ